MGEKRLFSADEVLNLGAQPNQFEQGRFGQHFYLVVPSVEGFHECQHIFDAGLDFLGRFFVVFAFQNALAQHRHGRVQLAPFAPFQNDVKQLPGIAHGGEVIAPVAHLRNSFDQSPGLQFFDAGTDIGTRHAQGFGDFLGVQGPVGQEEKRVNLRHGAIDAPTGAHFAPVKNVFFHDGC